MAKHQRCDMLCPGMTGVPSGHPTVYLSDCTDPFWNLAFEEHLFDQLPADSEALLLYVNRKSVIIGKHQNPWLEANTALLRSRAVPLLRRISGGGTVYHDEGNLNYSFIMNRERFDRAENLDLVLSALRKLGIHGVMTDSYDLIWNGGKFSGNSFCFRRRRVLHHGTLLVNSHLKELGELLATGAADIGTHAVRSRPARTVNLAEVGDGVSLHDIRDQLCRRFSESREATELRQVGEEGDHVEETAELRQKNRSWEWVYGRTPEFTIAAGPGSWFIRVKKGRICSVESSETLPSTAESLIGRRFDLAGIATNVSRQRRPNRL